LLIRTFAYNGFCEQWVKTGLLLARRMTIPTGYPYVSIQEKIGKCDKSAFIGDEADLNKFYNPKKWKNTKPKSALYHGQLDKSVNGFSHLHTMEIYTGLYGIGKFLTAEMRSILQAGIYDKWIEYLDNPETNIKFKYNLLNMHKSGVRLNLKEHNFISLFWIFGVACFSCCLVFVVEKVVNYITMLCAI